MPLPALVVGGVFATMIVPLVVKVLVGLGVGFATFTGINLLLDGALEFIRSNLNNLPADMVQIFAMTKIDVYITMIFSAYAIKLTLKGLDSTGVLRKISLGSLPG